MKLIPLSNGGFAMVDDEDFDWLSNFSWRSRKGGNTYYAYTYGKVGMHTMILRSFVTNSIVDHKDGDGLNNTRGNIRLCTHAQNMQNRALSKNSKSGIKGVYFNKKSKKWRSEIRSNGKRYCIGSFESKEDASIAYKIRAKELHGDFYRVE